MTNSTSPKKMAMKRTKQKKIKNRKSLTRKSPSRNTRRLKATRWTSSIYRKLFTTN
jgi:hypothetical protein